MKYGVCWCRCSEINFCWGVPLIGGLFLLFFEFDGVMENETVKRTLPDKDK